MSLGDTGGGVKCNYSKMEEVCVCLEFLLCLYLYVYCLVIFILIMNFCRSRVRNMKVREKGNLRN